jgi:hypothetical protein
MTTSTDPLTLTADVRSLLRQVRRRIRRYVVCEGLALAVAWLGATFWFGLALDYLPVLMGASEMPRGPRAVLLAAIIAVLVYVSYRWILQRAFARLPDPSMALLVERRFRRFQDGLVTAVELAGQPDRAAGFHPEMLARTRAQAQQLVRGLRAREVFRPGPLAAKVLLALSLVVPIGVFYVLRSDAVEIWVDRLYLLDDRPWPRSAHVEVAGIQIQRAAGGDGVVTLSDVMPFDEQREIKVAKGSTVRLLVRADAAHVVHDYCTIYYQTAQGDQGTVTMPKQGRIREHFQDFVYDGKPFRGILSSIVFDVRGHDHRVRDYRLQVVPSPALVETTLDCQFPTYLVDEQLSLWLPRTINLASGTQLPRGTRVKVRARANKDLTLVELWDSQRDTTTTIDVAGAGSDPRMVEYEVESLQGDLTLALTLHDTDGVVSDPPIRLFVAGVEDQPPTVAATLRGIGAAVTPDVQIPAVGQITDDYDIDRAWFDVVVNQAPARAFPLALAEGGQLDAALDVRAERARDGGLELKPTDKLALTIMAADKCNLAELPNVGTGDRYQLDVVTPDELLSALERRELGLRRRLEQIIEEVGQLRDAVSRVRRTATGAATLPDDEAPAADAATDTSDPAAEGTAEDREQSLRALRTQRALVQCQKSAQEVLGVAASFDDIREELINNRIDSEDRKVRLKEQIADPLRSIGEGLFPQLDARLKELEQQLGDAAASDQAVDRAVLQADNILLELDRVLQKILELETFNELMNIVRSLIEDQNQLMDRTKKARADEALELLK